MALAAETSGRHVQLAALDHANKLLAKAETLNEVKVIRDQAQALATYSRAAKLGLEMQNRCAALKLRAERKAGQMLAKMNLKPGPKGDADTLSAIGIAQHQSSRWQRVAGIPAAKFDAMVKESISLIES